MKCLYSLVCLFFCLTSHLIAQPISGVIRDAETQETLPFASIVIADQHRGTVSNIEGAFVLDLQGTTPSDMIVISYVGYDAYKITVADFQKVRNVFLQPATINLQDVKVLSRSLTAKEIVELVYENFEKNYPNRSVRQKIFQHHYERTPFPDENKVQLKKTNFEGLDAKTVDELLAMLPDEFVEYQDAQVELLSHDGNHKLLPIEGISLEEGSQKELEKKMEEKLKTFFDDVNKTNDNEETYYKFRTGIFAFKAQMDSGEKDSVQIENQKDSLHHHVPTHYVKGLTKHLFYEYANAESDNWEMISHTGKYDYELGDMTIYNDELVYAISFAPKGRGLYQGTMYVSSNTYAILQLDFEYAPGKKTENIQLLGIGHAMLNKKGRVLFEREDSTYFVKYIYAYQHETASIDRQFSIMKKQKRFLFDKELNEIKFKIDLYFDINTYWELMVMDRSTLTVDDFNETTEPKSMKFRKEYVYSPEMWHNSTVIAPTAELQQFKRKQTE